ncbi:hypothetical protein SELMODRAFT_114156 [Selaginella moellendorffii]|uniref:Pentacotripeptide-repeat region of PRORP domain-containing protein n=1 Tax=Selaginella moellendorffii TaxID=88036 RepID=D8SDN1_SELML|nr:hypothetical protein SELMODRAFT_114156 [Selaginella moellendorffii]
MILQAYRKLGQLDLACAVFAGICNRDLFSWTIMIAAFARDGHFSEALLLFRRMELDGIKPSPVTCVTVLASFTGPRLLPQARKFHARIEALGLESNVIVGTAVITMYGKCGSLTDSRLVFERMPQKNLNVISWTSIVSAHAQAGDLEMTQSLFAGMQLDGVAPDSIAFVSVLSSCSHGGLLESFPVLLRCMVEDCEILPRVEHYGCVVDALGRCGKLDEAERFVEELPVRVAVLWIALLAACSTHKDVRRARRVAERAFALEPRNWSTYVMFANILGEAGERDESAAIKQRMEELKARSQEKGAHIS